MTDTQSAGGAEWAPPAPRTITEVERDLQGLDSDLAKIARSLMTPRNRLAGAVQSIEDPAALRAVRDELMPPLAEAETWAIRELDRVLDRLRADEKTLTTAGAFRHDLTAAEQASFPTALSIARTQLETLAPDQIEAAIRSAIVHQDRPMLAALVSLGSVIDARKLPAAHAVRNALDDARAMVQDGTSRRTVAQIREQIATVTERRAALVTVANAEQPGSLGSFLERYVFGRAPVGGPPPRESPGVDWHRLMRRCGRTV